MIKPFGIINRSPPCELAVPRIRRGKRRRCASRFRSRAGRSCTMRFLLSALPILHRVNKGVFFFVHAVFLLRLLRTPWYSTLCLYLSLLYIQRKAFCNHFSYFAQKKRTPERRVFVRQYWVRPKNLNFFGRFSVRIVDFFIFYWHALFTKEWDKSCSCLSGTFLEAAPKKSARWYTVRCTVRAAISHRTKASLV